MLDHDCPSNWLTGTDNLWVSLFDSDPGAPAKADDQPTPSEPSTTRALQMELSFCSDDEPCVAAHVDSEPKSAKSPAKKKSRRTDAKDIERALDCFQVLERTLYNISCVNVST